MSVKTKDIKLLWGNAASICSMKDCRKRLSEEGSDDSKYPIGEQAHIVGEASAAPRGNSSLTAEERNSYYNLILLCPTCHTKIDKNEKDFPVEKLHMQKAQHEEYVRKTLLVEQDRKAQAENEFYIDLTEYIVIEMRLSDWGKISAGGFSSDPVIPKYFYDGIKRVYEKVKKAAWRATNAELEAAIVQLAKVSRDYVWEFTQHCDFVEDELRSIKFYNLNGRNEVMYNKLLSEYQNWISKSDKLLVETMKSLNWFADVVRRDLNPFFFHIDGRFTNPHESLESNLMNTEYTNEQKVAMTRK